MVVARSKRPTGTTRGPRHAANLRKAPSMLPLIGLFCSLVGPGHAFAQCEYQATPIQPPACPIFGILAAHVPGLSNAGHAVGWHSDCALDNDVAFVWTPQLGLVDIPFPAGTADRRALDINSAGRIVGRVDLNGDGLNLAFVLDGGTLTNLGTLPGGNFSEAVAVNEVGQVAGNAVNLATGDPPFTPFMWQDGVMTPLNLPLGPNGMVRAINEQGQIAGWMGVSNTIDSHAFIWEAGVVTDLGLAPGTFASEATAINNAGQVLIAGQIQKDNSPTVLVRPFLWDDGEWTDLGVLPGFDRCAGLDLNDAQQVVGLCLQSEGPLTEAFLWQDGVMMRLEDLVAPTPEGVSVFISFAINESGQIVALGGFRGDIAGLLLTPIDEPSGDLDHDCTVGIHDFVMVLAAWGPCAPSGVCPGDLDGNGVVGIVDLLLLLANWTF